MSKEEAYNLLRRYDDTQEHSEALIAELEESKYEQLKDLMINPMLVSLLYKAYSYKPKVPFKKHIFYRQVFDALFDMHDSTKGGAFIRKKNSNLDIDEFHSIMRDIGFTTAKLGKIEYDKDGILDIIKKVRERNPSILFQPAALLTDLVTTVPLFNKEGEHYKWAHKSVQDYFASQFIAVDAKGNECAILEKIYDGGHCRRFENILDLLHDTDNKSFRRVLLHKLLKDYVDHYDNKYNSPFPGVSLESITRRKQLTFGGNTAIGLISFEEFDEIIKSPSSIAKKFKHLSPKAINSDSLTFFQFSKKCFILLFNPSPAAGLLPLLAAKKYSYIAKASESYDYDEKALANFNCDTGFVSDDPDSPMNAPDCFDVVNHLLENHGFLITIEQARRTLRSIEEESNDSDQVNQMLQNL